jgi:iron complex outermembrane recepter protein
VVGANYVLPRWPAASLDLRVVHVGRAPESVDNRVFTSPVTSLAIGGRYRFTAFGKNSTLRIQAQNVFGTKIWQQLNTPGVFQFPGPRRVFVYLTTDF